MMAVELSILIALPLPGRDLKVVLSNFIRPLVVGAHVAQFRRSSGQV
jgi:hypothetical protein